jgi:catechol 2,3-dioxygenase-like lactoylglutathione lyase family enzyme
MFIKSGTARAGAVDLGARGLAPARWQTMMSAHGPTGGSNDQGLASQCIPLPGLGETRSFYEDFLGLRFVSAFEIDEGRGLHSFFEMDDGSCLAFFEVPGKPFDFKRQDTLDLHIALGVEPDVFDRMLDKARREEIEVRGPVDHGFCRSIYMRDPNGYVVELTTSTGVQQEIMDPFFARFSRRQACAPGGGITARRRAGW